MVLVMFRTLAEMKHFIRTSFGDSDTYYTQADVQFHGIGQGNGAGPMIWVMVSSPLLQRLRTLGFGIRLMDNGGNIYDITAFTFVDDNDLVQDIHNIAECAQLPQKALDAWNDSLQATGGACAPEKSCWTALIHKWGNNNKWSLGSTREFPGDITLKDDNGLRQRIKRVSPTEATLALGIIFSPSA